MSENIALCWRPLEYNNKWTCELGYTSVQKANKAFNDVRKQYPVHDSRLVPFSRLTPYKVQEWTLPFYLASGIPPVQFSRIK